MHNKIEDIGADAEVGELVQRALAEDAGAGDVTSQALVAESSTMRGVVLARQPLTVAGVRVATRCFGMVDPALRCEVRVEDGGQAKPNETLLTVQGSARAILMAERTALNFMQHMCGIASLTRRFVEVASRYGVDVLDTRKTTPGLRRLEKYAVTCGGGVNHRMGLHDRCLVKDNHRALWGRAAPLRLADAVREARRAFPDIPVEIEVETEAELADALAGEPDWILLDNMSPLALKRCVGLTQGKCRLEASGRITLESLEDYARTGVDALSLGCLTHSAPAADLSLELEIE